MEASNSLCWLWWKSSFLHSNNQSSIQKEGKKQILSCKNEVTEVWYIATLYLSQKNFLWYMVFIQRIMISAISIQLLCVGLYDCKFCLLHAWTLAPHFNNKNVVHWHFCFALVLQVNFKILVFYERNRIWCSNKKTPTNHNQTLILWTIWYEFPSNRNVLFCWSKCTSIHVRWAIPV